MSKIALEGNASGTGTLTIAAPNTSTDRTLTLPDESGTVLTSGGAIDVNASAPADSLAISSAGNVGVGTTSPQVKLQVAGDVLNSIGASYGTNIYYDAGAATNKYLANGFGGVLTVAESGSGGFRFYTAPSNSGGAGANATITERARITSDGVLLVGTTSATPGAKVESFSPATGPVTCFLATQGAAGDYCYTSKAFNNSGVFYHFNFTEAGTQRGSITSNGTSTSYLTGSDYRLKDNIAPLTGALAKVLQLQPRVWTWKTNGSDGQGFIAHELQAVVPDCVTGEKDAVETYTDEEGNEQTRPVYQGVDTSFLVATLTAAIQELKAINDAQASRIETLEAKVAALEAK